MAKDTLFRIASMTKPITAIGIMILADEGKLSPDDDVAKHLPEFTGQMLEAEGRQGHDRPEEAGPAGEAPRPAHAHRRPRQLPDRAWMTCTRSATARSPRRRWPRRCGRCSSSPARKWAYSNPGIDTLGRVIEVVSGEIVRGVPEEARLRPARHDRHHVLPDVGAAEAAGDHLRQEQGRQPGRQPNSLIGLPAQSEAPDPRGRARLVRGRPREALPHDAATRANSTASASCPRRRSRR